MSENLWVLFRAQHKLVTETLRPNTTMTIISSHNFLGSQNIPVQGRALLAAAGFLAQELVYGKGIFQNLTYILSSLEIPSCPSGQVAPDTIVCKACMKIDRVVDDTS
jgi:hypothetical protein